MDDSSAYSIDLFKKLINLCKTYSNISDKEKDLLKFYCHHYCLIKSRTEKITRLI